MMVDKVILKFVHSPKNIIGADSDDENEMNNVAPFPTSSQMKNVRKNMRSYIDTHSNGEMNNKMDDTKKFHGQFHKQELRQSLSLIEVKAQADCDLDPCVSDLYSPLYNSLKISRKVDPRSFSIVPWRCPFPPNLSKGQYSCAYEFQSRHITRACGATSKRHRGRIVAYRDCGLSFREIGSRVGRNQTTVMRICDRWIQEGTTDRRGRSQPPLCTTSREDRQIVHMAVMDRSVTSRTVAQHIESVTHHSVSARTIQRRLQQSGLSARRPFLVYPSRRTTDVSATNGATKEGCGQQNGMMLSLLTCHASIFNTTMARFESGDTVERGY
ncbi:HTH_38 domain-containing protein [Trichonephila clavipes]|nr:HTH_38 domain-containing protein [Trichonephila clavipes]